MARDLDGNADGTDPVVETLGLSTVRFRRSVGAMASDVTKLSESCRRAGLMDEGRHEKLRRLVRWLLRLGRTSIWSLRKWIESVRFLRLATVEVDDTQRLIVQVRGRLNQRRRDVWRSSVAEQCRGRPGLCRCGCRLDPMPARNARARRGRLPFAAILFPATPVCDHC